MQEDLSTLGDLPDTTSDEFGAGAFGGRFRGSSGAGRNKTLYGKQLTLNALTGAGSGALNWQTIVQTPEEEDAIDWEGTFQVLPPYPASGTVYIRVSYTLGEVTFYKRPYPVAKLGAFRFQVKGQRVQVDVALANAATAGPTTSQVLCGVGKASLIASPRDYYFGQWIQNQPANSAPWSGIPFILDTGPGVLMGYDYSLQTGTADTLTYLAFYDLASTTSLLVGASSPFWTSRPITSASAPANDQFFDGDDFKIRYSNGVVVAASASAGFYTPISSTGTTFLGNLFTKIGF